ncbi:WD40-repeat-containing domain protein [Xylariaceae sp. AK1471]|nr:WD40-repeat-containing domain protein [Xylariaceae sp. AK1471]
METQEREIASLRSVVLSLPPSCIEFCPAHPDHFIVGTYNLQKDEPTQGEKTDASNNNGSHETIKKHQSRNGSLVVFRLAEDANDLLHVQTVSHPSALLDLHFHPHQNKHEVLAAVSSTGTLSFFRLSPRRMPSAPLVELATHKPLGDDESLLFLSCAWHPSLPDLLAITTSDYQVHILRVDNSWSAHQTSSTSVIMHTLEAWTVAFSPFPTGSQVVTNDLVRETSHGFMIYSGGDDSKLLSTTCFYKRDQDNNTETDEDDITVPYPTIRVKGHTAGVTAILPLSLTLLDGSRVIISGSYDDCLRLHSVHSQVGGVMLGPPKLLAEKNLGGGVWRLKLIKLEQTSNEDAVSRKSWSALILASCMHAGSRVLEITGDYSDSCQIHVLGWFEEHKSMNYGSDFQPGTELDGRSLRCVSTSFYDKLLCLWKF